MNASAAVTPALRPSLDQSPLASGPLVYVGGLWLLSAVVSESPLGERLWIKAAALLLPLALTSLIVLLRPADGLALWGLGLTFLVVQTGFQFDVGRVRFSVLEGVIVVVTVAILWHTRRWATLRDLTRRLPGRTAWLLFAAYAALVLVVGALRGDALDLASIEFKGFLLYPVMVLILAAGWREARLLRLAVALVLGWYAIVAGRGLLQFWQAETLATWDTLTRASGGYGPINVYGITLMACSLLALGLGLAADRPAGRLIGWGLAAWLLVGAAVSASRTVWICYGLGLAWLWLTAARRRAGVWVMGLLVIALLAALPGLLAARIFQFSDSSFIRRQFYLLSGLHAAAESWLFGWGWGNGYWYTALAGLVPSGWIPWYHNDYLNLWVQTGLIGVALYVGYWARLLWAGQQGSRRASANGLCGYALGSQAALVALLAAALFEHVLWRPDSAGVVGWMAGLMLASAGYAWQEQAQP